MQGIVLFLWILFGALLLALVCYALMRIPAKLVFSLQTDLFSGGARLNVRHPLVSHAFRFRFTLLAPPRFRLELLRRDGRTRTITGARKKRDSTRGMPQALLSCISLEALELRYTLGLGASAAETALLSGLLCAVTRAAFPVLLAPFASARASVRADALWDCRLFRVKLEGIACASPAQIMKRILSEKRRSRHDASY